jgi:DNA-binding MarR family transcriptional regulator
MLAAEIKQSKPFASRELEAYLNLQRTADVLRHGVVDVLKGHGLSPTGYNVLRILRGAGESGLPCSEVAARLVSHDPDITRLSDRLAQAGLIERVRSASDRRVVLLRITRDGAALAQRLAPQLDSLHRRLLGHLGDERLTTLIGLLEQARTKETT